MRIFLFKIFYHLNIPNIDLAIFQRSVPTVKKSLLYENFLNSFSLKVRFERVMSRTNCNYLLYALFVLSKTNIPDG